MVDQGKVKGRDKEGRACRRRRRTAARTTYLQWWASLSLCLPIWLFVSLSGLSVRLSVSNRRRSTVLRFYASQRYILSLTNHLLTALVRKWKSTRVAFLPKHFCLRLSAGSLAQCDEGNRE